MRYMFIPWARDEAEDLSPAKNPPHEPRTRLNWSEVSKKEFTIVYLDDKNDKVFSFPDAGGSAQIYVRGHGFTGGDKIMPANDPNHKKAVNFDVVCEMLIAKGLEKNFSGKLKFYNCYSYDSNGDQLGFACRCTSYLRGQGYTKATYYGYTKPIIGHYSQNTDPAVGNHKYSTFVNSQTPNNTKWRTSAQQYRLEPDAKDWIQKTVEDIQKQDKEHAAKIL